MDKLRELKKSRSIPAGVGEVATLGSYAPVAAS
jgi:hypothetical protein